MQNLFICKFHEACKEIKIPRKIWNFFFRRTEPKENTSSIIIAHTRVGWEKFQAPSTPWPWGGNVMALGINSRNSSTPVSKPTTYYYFIIIYNQM